MNTEFQKRSVEEFHLFVHDHLNLEIWNLFAQQQLTFFTGNGKT